MSPAEQQLFAAPGSLIPLSQAAKLTPYSSEYLRLLVRKGSVKAIKIRRDWLTTEAAVLEYVEQQKERHHLYIEELSKPQTLKNQNAQAGFAPVKLLLVLGLAIVATSGFLILITTGIPPNKTLAQISAPSGLLSLGQALLGKTTEEYLADAPAPIFALAKHRIEPRGPEVPPHSTAPTSVLADESATHQPQVLGQSVTKSRPIPSMSASSVLSDNTTVGDLTALIANAVQTKLDQLLASGILKGPKGDKGDAPAVVIPANPGLAYAPTSYYQPNQSQNFSGGSLQGVTMLSSNSFSTHDASVGNNLTVGGSSTFSGESTFTGNTTFSNTTNLTGTTTIANLTVTAVNPSLTLGSVVFQGPAGLAQDNANFFWDDANNRLGVGTSSPIAQLELAGAGQAVTNNYGLFIDDKTAGTNNWNIYSGPAASGLNAVWGQFEAGVTKNFFARKGPVTSDFQDSLNSYFEDSSLFQVQGFDGVAIATNNAGTKSLVAGVVGGAGSVGNGIVDKLFGVDGYIEQDGIGTINSAAALHADNGTISAGTINNGYGLLVDDQTAGTNNWNIWSGAASVAIDPYAEAGVAPVVFNHTQTAAQPYGMVSFVNTTNTNAVGVAVEGNYTTSGSGGGAILEGVLGDIYHYGTGTIGTAAGISGYTETGGGKITNAYNFWSQSSSVSAPGTIDNLYGLKVDDQTAGTNNYNIWSGPAASTFNASDLGWVSKNTFAVNGVNGSAVSEYALSGIAQSADGGSVGLQAFANAVGNNPIYGPTGAQTFAEWTFGTGTMATLLQGLEAGVGNTATGTVDSAAAINIDANYNTGAGAITNNYGLKVADQTAGTNNWNIWSGPASSTLNSDIQRAAGVVKNFFVTKDIPTDGGVVLLGALQDSTLLNGNALGGYAESTNGAGTTKASITGTYGYAVHSGAGIVTDSYALYGQAQNISSGTTTNAYGTYIDSAVKSAGVIANNYGINVQDQTAGTNNWNIYSGPPTSEFNNDNTSWVLTYKNAFGAKNDGLGVLSEVNAATGNFAGTTLAVGTIHGSGNVSTSASLYLLNDHSGAGTVGGQQALGIESYQDSGAGVVTNMYGINVLNQKDSNNTTDGVYGVNIRSTVKSTGTITNLYGINVQDQTVGTNNYSIYTNQTAGANNYAYYGAGTGKSYFGGNVGIGTSSPPHLITLSGGAFSDGATWSNASDRNIKENFATVTPADILQKIDALDIQQWNYKTDSASTTHIGPTAQDFYTAFRTGGDSGQTSISTIDPSGVALLGIQALDQKITALQGSLTANATTSNLTVYNPGNFSGDSVGEAKILTGQTSVRVIFSQPYQYQPIVTITAEDQATPSFITHKDSNGFTIEVPTPVTSDTIFDWHSFASQSEKLFVSDGSTQTIQMVISAANSSGVSLPLSDPTSSDQTATSTPDASSTPVSDLPTATSTPSQVLGTSTTISESPLPATPEAPPSTDGASSSTTSVPASSTPDAPN